MSSRAAAVRPRYRADEMDTIASIDPKQGGTAILRPYNDGTEDFFIPNSTIKETEIC